MERAERRGGQRRRVLMAARATIAGRSTFDCTVRNLSDGGALLMFPSTVGVPEAFVLTLISTGEAHSCKAAWRSPERMGVSFVPSMA